MRVPPPLWGSPSKRKPFGAPVLQECKNFGPTSSSTSSLSSQGWSNTVRPDNFLHLVATWWRESMNNGCDCAAPLIILPHSPTPQLCLDKQRGKVSAQHPALRALPGGGDPSDSPHRALCMHLIPLSPHTATPPPSSTQMFRTRV